MIIAIGGGEISQGQTLKIDKFIVSQAKKPHPKLLFIPIASLDAIRYIKTFKNVYGSLGRVVEALCLHAINYQDEDIRENFNYWYYFRRFDSICI